MGEAKGAWRATEASPILAVHRAARNGWGSLENVMKQKRKSSLSSLENQPLNAVTPEALQDRKEFKKMLMDQVRTSGGTSAVDTKQIFQGLVKDTLEAFLELEMEEHLGYPKHDAEGRNSGNSRNGASSTTVRGDFGEVEIDTPRDRNASFEPKVVAKRQTSVGKFSEAVISLYTRGLSTREIEQHVKEIYGLDISPQFVSRVTEELRQQIVEWQNRPLGRVYPTSVAAWRTHWNELTTFFFFNV